MEREYLHRLGNALIRRSVCPYARQAWRDGQIQWLHLEVGAGINPIPARPSLYFALDKFLNSQDRVLLVLFSDEFMNHYEAHLAAKRLFLELAIAVNRVNAPDMCLDKILNIWINRFYSYLVQAHVPIEKPLIPCKRKNGTIDDALFVFVANPLFGINHPRFAPVPMLIVTYQSDIKIANINFPQVTDEINRAAIRRILSPFIETRSSGQVNVRSHIKQIPSLSQAHGQYLIDHLFQKGFYELPSPLPVAGTIVKGKSHPF